MANSENLAELQKGPEAWNRWRKKHPDVLMDFTEADLRAANLSGADLAEAQLQGAKLMQADLGGAKLSEADLGGANLGGANLAGADLAEADLAEANLGRAILSEAKLEEAKLLGADLAGANLGRAILRGANLGGANLSGANLAEADLSSVDFGSADLGGANLGGAKLSGANLAGADLGGADFHETVLRETLFGATDLRDVKGLETCKHRGPSMVDYRTLVKSGPLPLAFLRGCGLPDALINFLPSLLNQPIQFYSCFISYSTKDQKFAERLYADLQNKGVRCWFAPHDIQGGKKIHEQIDEAIRLYDRLLLLLSEHSMESKWVKTEIANARAREEREKQRMLFPVRLVDFETLRDWKCFDADTGTDSAREIREYFIPDFSKWKDHDSYQKAFDRLLKDLKAEAERVDTAKGRAD
jgi:uncharacterized protein YjbI with pentapeptide repeats